MLLACALDSAQSDGLPACSSASRKTQRLGSAGERQLVLKTFRFLLFWGGCVWVLTGLLPPSLARIREML